MPGRMIAELPAKIGSVAPFIPLPALATPCERCNITHVMPAHFTDP
jgi:uncharacterized protein YcbX